nr:hypothetical protein Iba_chr03aCG6430 [Ipomoea batatas]
MVILGLLGERCKEREDIELPANSQVSESECLGWGWEAETTPERGVRPPLRVFPVTLPKGFCTEPSSESWPVPGLGLGSQSDDVARRSAVEREPHRPRAILLHVPLRVYRRSRKHRTRPDVGPKGLSAMSHRGRLLRRLIRPKHPRSTPARVSRKESSDPVRSTSAVRSVQSHKECSNNSLPGPVLF